MYYRYPSEALDIVQPAVMPLLCIPWDTSPCALSSTSQQPALSDPVCLPIGELNNNYLSYSE